MSAPDAVAWIGGAPIALATLQQASAASKIAPALALERLITARVLGLYANRGGLERGRRQMVDRALLARVLLEQMEARATSPETAPTDDEVEAMTKARWIELDRSEARRTCHALVQGEKLDEAAGISLAERLADALRPYTECHSFLERARVFPVAGAKIVAEEVPPVTEDGRTLIVDAKGGPTEEGAQIDLEYARAAHRIGAIGAQSGITRTQFGWHIILLVERLPPKRVPMPERRQLLTDDILRKRAKEVSLRWIAEARTKTSIVVERAAVEAIGRVQVAP